MEQGVVTDSAYPHWAWLQPQLASTSGHHCVVAWSNYQYDRFLGDSSDSSQVRSQAFYQTASADRRFGWGAQPCGMRFASVCAVPVFAFPCFPPPSPPPPPPSPPVPPTPPLPPSCAPRTSATFYCDAVLGMCYNYTTSAAGFNAAWAACQAQNGELVRYDSGDKQLRVEGFFRRFGTLTANMYWQGLNRASQADDVTYTSDGTPVQLTPSNEPYAHW